MEYLMNRAGQQYGPYPAQDIAGLIQAGNIGPDDHLWSEGMADWLPARSVFPHLFAAPGPGVHRPVAAPGQRAHPPGYTQHRPRSFRLASAGSRLSAWFVDVFLGFACFIPILIGMMSADLSSPAYAEKRDAFLATALPEEDADARKGMTDNQKRFADAERSLTKLQLESGYRAGQMMAGQTWQPIAALGLTTALGLTNLILLCISGQTLGKKAIGIRVATHPDSGRTGFVRAVLLRYFVFGLVLCVAMLLLLLGGLALANTFSSVPIAIAVGVLTISLPLVDLLLVFSDTRRRFADRIAGTQVVDC